MPLKASKKAAPAPEPKKEASTKSSNTKTAGTKTSSPTKKTKEPIVFTAVEKDQNVVTPIDISFSGTSHVAKAVKGEYVQHLKLGAAGPFTIVKTTMFPEDHELAGHQVIVIRPAKAFAFLKLPVEVRAEVYKLYFAGKGIVDAAIVLDGKRAGSKAPFAKTYADGSKTRVGILAVNKEIHNEAKDIFYAHAIKVETSNILLEFLSSLDSAVLQKHNCIEIKSLVKSSSRVCFHLLAGATKLSSLHIQGLGISSEGDPGKVAKLFHADCYKFLEAMAAARAGDKQAAVEVLHFGRETFTYKDDAATGKAKGAVKPWSAEMKLQFRESLQAKLK